MAEKSASELHISALNWLTGLAPAAAGACIILLLDPKTPANLLFGIGVLVALLLLGFVFGTLAQLHAIRIVGLRSVGSEEVSGAERHMNFFLVLTLAMLYLAVALVCFGAIFTALRRPPPEPSLRTGWKVLSSNADSVSETIVVATDNQSEIVILRRMAGEKDWASVGYAKNVSQ